MKRRAPRKPFSLEGASVSLRFILPIMFAFGWNFYQKDASETKTALAEIKDNQRAVTEKLWSTLSSFKDDTNRKFDEIYQRRR